jgi:prephenate dehydrogenase
LRIHIVGAGLIGTSLGLAFAQKSHRVSFEDSNQENLRVAKDLIGGAELAPDIPFDLLVIATPSEVVFSTLVEKFSSSPRSMFIDISGLKSELIREVESFPDLAKRFCGTHPMAGREISGPTAARADLFEGASWIITPTSVTEPEILKVVSGLLVDLGTTTKVVDAPTHDRAIAAVSHIPQFLSSLLARTLLDKESGDLELAGQGLRDLTRLADGNAELWSQLFVRNSENVKSELAQIQRLIDLFLGWLEVKDSAEIKRFLEEGKTGKSRIPGKHGGKSREYSYLPIVIEDKPGQLASIFDECKKVHVNIEDLFIEHSPGQQTGLITLALSHDDASILRTHLANQNWRVHAIRAQR